MNKTTDEKKPMNGPMAMPCRFCGKHLNEGAIEGGFCSARCRDTALRVIKGKKVMAAICCRDSLHTAFFANIPGGIFEAVRISTTFPLDQARDELTRAFLANKEFTHMMIIDADVVSAPNLVDLFLVDAPLVSAFCWIAGPIHGQYMPVPGLYRWNPPGDDKRFTTWAMNDVRNAIMEANEAQRLPIVDADLVGGGCWMMDRRTAERTMDDHGSWFRLTWEEGKQIRHGEDVYFYERARALGLKFKVHLGVECGHMKNVDLRYMGHMIYGMLPPEFYEKLDSKEGL